MRRCTPGLACFALSIPMNIRRTPSLTATSDTALRDITRIQQIWDGRLSRTGGPWLFGEFSIADAFFAPIALRFATYRTPLTPLSMSFQSRILVDPAVQEWCGQAAAEMEWVAADER